MKSLSTMKYYRHNKGRLLLLVIPLFLCITLLYMIHTVITSYYNVQYNAFVETRKYYTSIQAHGNLVSDGTIDTIKNYESTEKVVPCILGYTEMYSVLSPVGVRIYSLYQNDLQELIDRMGLVIADGRLPLPGAQEIVLHESVMKNKGLAIGDMLGSDVTYDERLTGKYQIVGCLRGVSLAGFTSLETWVGDRKEINPQNYGVLIYAKDGKQDELNLYLEYLPIAGNEISSFEISSSGLGNSSGNIYLILNIIYLSVLIIVSICLGFLTYLFYRNRLQEFAVFYIIGYSRQAILLRNVTDVVVINAVTFIAAILASMLITVILNAAIFIKLGTPLLLFDGKTFVLSMCVPLLCVVAQTLSIYLSLNDTDMVSVIEFESGGIS